MSELQDGAERLPVMGGSISCNDYERILWTDGPDAVPAEHFAGCRSCREESRKAADLQAALAGMRNRFALPPSGLENDLIAVANRGRFDRVRAIASHPKFWKTAAVAGGVAAGVAGAALGVMAARKRTASRVDGPDADADADVEVAEVA